MAIDLSPHLDRVATRLSQVVRHGQVTLGLNETGTLARAQISLSDIETYDNVPHIQQFGFASSPLVGSAVLLLSTGGDISQSYIVGTHDPRHRPQNMASGEVTVHDAHGNSIYLSQGADGIIIRAATKVTVIAPDVAVTATGGIILDTPTVTMTHNLHVQGMIMADQDIVSGTISLQHHTHTDSKGGITSAPR